MTKRGQAEQFNWIFVVVAGAIILGFFTMFTFKYIELQKKRQDIDSIKLLGDRILAVGSKLHVGGGASVDAQGDEGIRFGYDVDFRYVCNDDVAHILVGKNNYDYRLQDEIVFMDKEVRFRGFDEGADLWILPWNFPYHVTNFIYLANSKDKFYLVYDSSSGDFVNELEISGVFDVEFVKFNEIGIIRPNSKIIFLTQNEPSTSDIEDLKKDAKYVSFVYVNNNEARFFDQGKWSRGIKFYSLEQFYGTIFSNDADTFECNIKRALDKTANLAGLYIERARVLNQLDRREGCQYSQIADALSQYASGKFELKDELEKLNLGGGCIWVF